MLKILIILPLMAFATIQLIIEVQPRYRIDFVPILAIIAGFGFSRIYQFFIKHNKKTA